MFSQNNIQITSELRDSYLDIKTQMFSQNNIQITYKLRDTYLNIKTQRSNRACKSRARKRGLGAGGPYSPC